MNTYQKILHLPISNTDEKVIKIFKGWAGSLASFDMEISTGPVVDFRNGDLIFNKKEKNTVPLIWLHNITPMKTKWPLKNGYKGKIKGQYIISNKISVSRLVENKNYIFLRRFSTKDENRRLIAAPYLKDIKEAPMLGLENHMNYIYRKNGELSDIETIGLSVLLNSKLFDLYFRTFNGNINVSATELRDFPLPELNLIKTLGKKAMQMQKEDNQIDIEYLILKVFNLSIDLSKQYE